MPVTPSDNEQEYFQREEMERLRRLRDKATTAAQDSDAARLKELHWMRCPKCGLELAEVAFRGVKVDTCFGCGGMFFDRGEIDQLGTPDEPGLVGRVGAVLFGKRDD